MVELSTQAVPLSGISSGRHLLIGMPGSSGVASKPQELWHLPLPAPEGLANHACQWRGCCVLEERCLLVLHRNSIPQLSQEWPHEFSKLPYLSPSNTVLTLHPPCPPNPDQSLLGWCLRADGCPQEAPDPKGLGVVTKHTQALLHPLRVFPLLSRGESEPQGHTQGSHSGLVFLLL